VKLWVKRAALAVLVIVGGLQVGAVAPARAQVCTGDCGLDGAVTVDEILRGVNIALGNLVLADCPPFDQSDDGQVTVDEILQAVNNALDGCPVVTPEPTAVPTATPTTGGDANTIACQQICDCGGAAGAACVDDCLAGLDGATTECQEDTKALGLCLEENSCSTRTCQRLVGEPRCDGSSEPTPTPTLWISDTFYCEQVCECGWWSTTGPTCVDDCQANLVSRALECFGPQAALSSVGGAALGVCAGCGCCAAFNGLRLACLDGCNVECDRILFEALEEFATQGLIEPGECDDWIQWTPPPGSPVATATPTPTAEPTATATDTPVSGDPNTIACQQLCDCETRPVKQCVPDCVERLLSDTAECRADTQAYGDCLEASNCSEGCDEAPGTPRCAGSSEPTPTDTPAINDNASACEQICSCGRSRDPECVGECVAQLDVETPQCQSSTISWAVCLQDRACLKFACNDLEAVVDSECTGVPTATPTPTATAVPTATPTHTPALDPNDVACQQICQCQPGGPTCVDDCRTDLDAQSIECQEATRDWADCRVNRRCLGCRDESDARTATCS
jgi:hypothetical protein